MGEFHRTGSSGSAKKERMLRPLFVNSLRGITASVRIPGCGVSVFLRHYVATEEKEGKKAPLGSSGMRFLNEMIQLVNDSLFDSLARKPSEQQHREIKHITNLQFSGIIVKHGILNTALVYIPHFCYHS